MSLIALRRGLRRRGRRLTAIAAVALLSALMVAHHGAISGHHAAAHPAETSMHQMHDLAPVPADADLNEICAAVLPGLLLLVAFALGGVALFRASWVLALPRPRACFIASGALDRRARAGPRVLCVMRC